MVDVRSTKVDVVHIVARAQYDGTLGLLEPGTKLIAAYDDPRQRAVHVVVRNALFAIAHEHRYRAAPGADDLREPYAQVRAFHAELLTLDPGQRSAARRLVRDASPERVPDVVGALKAASACL